MFQTLKIILPNSEIMLKIKHKIIIIQETPAITVIKEEIQVILLETRIISHHPINLIQRKILQLIQEYSLEINMEYKDLLIILLVKNINKTKVQIPVIKEYNRETK